MSKKKPTLEQLQKAFEAVSLLREYFQPFDVSMHSGLYDSPSHGLPSLDINGAFIAGSTLTYQLTLSGSTKKEIEEFTDLYHMTAYVNSLFHAGLDNLHSRLFDIANYGSVKGKEALIPETGYNVALAPVGDVKIKLSDPDEFKLFI